MFGLVLSMQGWVSHLLPREGIYFLHVESVIPALAGVLATDQNNQTIKTEQMSIFGIYFKMCFSSFINDNKVYYKL